MLNRGLRYIYFTQVVVLYFLDIYVLPISQTLKKRYIIRLCNSQLPQVKVFGTMLYNKKLIMFQSQIILENHTFGVTAQNVYSKV